MTRMMPVATAAGALLSPGRCVTCGIPLDAKPFDESSVRPRPSNSGDQVVLARFELPPQYCGILEYFAQFTDHHAQDPSQIDTTGLEWKLLTNNRPLYPYLSLSRIVNPWGYGSFPVAIRLDDGATVELVVRNAGYPASGPITRIGGRIVGRFWYNAAYGDVTRRGP
jgi:hypothetical protein